MSNELTEWIASEVEEYDEGQIYCTKLYFKSEVDKVLVEKDKEIAELKARVQLDDDEMAGFLQLEEECGGGNLRNYITELKQKLDKAIAERDGNQVCIDALKAEIKRKEAVGQRWFERCMTERTDNCRLYRALCRLRIGFAKHFGRVNSGKTIVAYWKAKADEFKED